jgi:hypothetical protein
VYKQESRSDPPQISHLLPVQYMLQLAAVDATEPDSRATEGFELAMSSIYLHRRCNTYYLRNSTVQALALFYYNCLIPHNTEVRRVTCLFCVLYTCICVPGAECNATLASHVCAAGITATGQSSRICCFGVAAYILPLSITSIRDGWPIIVIRGTCGNCGVGAAMIEL